MVNNLTRRNRVSGGTPLRRQSRASCRGGPQVRRLRESWHHLVQSSEAFTAFVHSYDRFLGGSEVVQVEEVAVLLGDCNDVILEEAPDRGGAGVGLSSGLESVESGRVLGRRHLEALKALQAGACGYQCESLD